jgi:hypothetical protein
VATARWGCRSTRWRHRDDGLAADGIALAALILRGRSCGRRSRSRLRVQPSDRHPDLGRRDHRDGNTLEARGRRQLLRRFAFDPRLARLRDVLLLVGLAALLSTLISATFGVTAPALAACSAPRAIPCSGRCGGGRRDGRPADRAADLRVGAADALSRRPLRWLEALLLRWR